MPDIQDENVGADQLPGDGWMKLARELLERGELRLALRAFYLASLAHLAARNLISIARFKSNREYERELRRRGHSFPDLLAVFGDNLASFERIWYGLHEANRELVEPVRGQRGKDESRRMKKYFPLFLLLVCAAAFTFGLVRLFQLRFEVGDVYPAYSTLRSDPLGTMAFYESLGKVPGFSSRRDFGTSATVCRKSRTRFICNWPPRITTGTGCRRIFPGNWKHFSPAATGWSSRFSPRLRRMPSTMMMTTKPIP